MKYYNSKARQAGMTLIELTVVLLVLIGLAGLLIPYVTGFIAKTHDSTGDNNIRALNNAIARFEAQYGVYPDDLQLLALTSGSNTTRYSKLMMGAMGALSATTYASGSIQQKSLEKAGMTKFLSINPDAEAGTANATFAVASAELDATSSTIPVTIVKKGAETAVGSDDYDSVEEHLADAFGMRKEQFNAACYDYVVFGVGQESQLTGKTLNDAPVHFAKNQNKGPSKNYNRFIAVFQVDKRNGSYTPVTGDNSYRTAAQDCGAATEKAKFIGTGMMMKPPHLWGLAHSFSHTYDNLAADTVD